MEVKCVKKNNTQFTCRDIYQIINRETTLINNLINIIDLKLIKRETKNPSTEFLIDSLLYKTECNILLLKELTTTFESQGTVNSKINWDINFGNIKISDIKKSFIDFHNSIPEVCTMYQLRTGTHLDVKYITDFTQKLVSLLNQ